MTLEGDTLEPLSVISMIVVTMELLRSSAPSAESQTGAAGTFY
jgi:hypothetical protein